MDLLRRAKLRASIFDHFRKRWTEEYLRSLREFHRATGNNNELVKPGSVVLIHDDKPRLQWRLGLVKELLRGSDGAIRSVSLQTATGLTNRPINKLYPLEITADIQHHKPQPESTSEPPTEPIRSPRPSRRAADIARERIKSCLREDVISDSESD